MLVISVDLVTLDDLSAAALLESSSRIDSLSNAWERMNAEPPLAAPLASLPDPTKTAGIFAQFGTLCKRYIFYKQPGSLLSWISRLIVAAVLSLILGCIFWDIPASDPQLTYNDRLGYHHTVMGIAFWPIILFMIRDNQNDRKQAEKDIKLGLYGRTVYIFVQSILSVLPSLCIWLAYLLPAHSMAGLYSYTANSDAGIYLYMGKSFSRAIIYKINLIYVLPGFMMLYLIVIQTLALFSSHLISAHKIFASVFTILVMLIVNLSVGGYIVHPADTPDYIKWLIYVSPQKWLTPVLTKDEYSEETIASAGGLQLCRNKQVS